MPSSWYGMTSKIHSAYHQSKGENQEGASWPEGERPKQSKEGTHSRKA